MKKMKYHFQGNPKVFEDNLLVVFTVHNLKIFIFIGRLKISFCLIVNINKYMYINGYHVSNLQFSAFVVVMSQHLLKIVPHIAIILLKTLIQLKFCVHAEVEQLSVTWLYNRNN